MGNVTSFAHNHTVHVSPSMTFVKWDPVVLLVSIVKNNNNNNRFVCTVAETPMHNKSLWRERRRGYVTSTRSTLNVRIGPKTIYLPPSCVKVHDGMADFLFKGDN